MEPPIVNVKEYVDDEGDKSEWGKRIGDKENVGVHNLEDDTYVSYEFESTLRTEDSFFKDFVEHVSSNANGRYYLVDKGYLDKEGYLVPYSKLRYHQS
ncbi:hypothetical protein GH714_005112 [Hevea brasiliensis]|uniref:Uncharacterized protein n=1 Tax=Hevea brasiliensis TaxID=3981 RepID=A0A6A6KS25_HEVBR|nr:hypothetical protein GH714_005112 [Hevea brasiliensis]